MPANHSSIPEIQSANWKQRKKTNLAGWKKDSACMYYTATHLWFAIRCLYQFNVEVLLYKFHMGIYPQWYSRIYRLPTAQIFDLECVFIVSSKDDYTNCGIVRACVHRVGTFLNAKCTWEIMNADIYTELQTFFSWYFDTFCRPLGYNLFESEGIKTIQPYLRGQ